MQMLRWMRVPGDIVFAIGAAFFAWFVLGLLTGHSYDNEQPAGLENALHNIHKDGETELAVR
jgi:nitric oxide reductase subunit B